MPVVLLVCSTGGLNALGTVLAALPGDLPAAVIALQHLEPARASNLPELLAARTELPVAGAVDGDALVPGKILVAPPGHHVLISAKERVALIESGALPPYRPSADLLLTTAAIALGSRVIAVVLTGRGNDAATGATAVHHFGGTVIVSSEASSTQPAMPLATMGRDGITGHVADLSAVAALLVKLVTAHSLEPMRKLSDQQEPS
jgi:two-component system chemotaxis response regulator CheB